MSWFWTPASIAKRYSINTGTASSHDTVPTSSALLTARRLSAGCTVCRSIRFLKQKLFSTAEALVLPRHVLARIFSCNKSLKTQSYWSGPPFSGGSLFCILRLENIEWPRGGQKTNPVPNHKWCSISSLCKNALLYISGSKQFPCVE